MEKEPFISLVLPESVLGDNRLTYFERILLIDIVSLCKKNGYCWPTNRYFMNKFNCTKPTVSKSISSLSKNGYIDIEINNSETNNSKRIIRLSEVLKKRINLKPVLELKSKVVHVKELDADNLISYGGTFKTEKVMRIATVSIGYGDGYPRSLSNKGYVLINGKKAGICGRI